MRDFRSTGFRPFAPRRRRHGYTLAEVIVALALFGLLMAAVTRQLVESGWISFRTARTLEHAHTGRYALDQLAADINSAQSILLYPSFVDRSKKQAEGSYGNYLVLRELDANGTTTRTVGYYLTTGPAEGTWSLYRHDSRDGVLAPDALPNAATAGQHRLIVRQLRLPDGLAFFRNWRSRGATVRAQFGDTPGPSTSQLQYLQCTFTTRS